MSDPRLRLVHQIRRPQGEPRADDFAWVEQPLPEPAPGTALVENAYLSVDPYMRECMDAVWPLHAPLEGRSVGRVVASRDPRLAEGELVFHRQGWRSHALVRHEEVRVLPALEGVAASHWLSVLGGTGLTAYVALTRIAELREGETVYISAAAGGVGSMAGQLCRLLGAGRVIGSAGSAAKVAQLREGLGFDVAFNYRDRAISEQLAEAAPDGLDVYLDNVGGEHLEAAIGRMRAHGRIAWSGAIAQYSTQPPAAPRNLFEVVERSLRLQGFLVRDYGHLQHELQEFVVPHLRSGRLRPVETVVEGFDRVIDAFLGVLGGRNFGKMLVKLA